MKAHTTHPKKIIIIGSGIVGQATGKGFFAKGHDVTFCDINADILAKLQEEGFATCAPDEIAQKHADVFMLCIETPTVHGRIRLEHFLAAVEHFAKNVLQYTSKYVVVVVRSTMPPGTVEKQVIPVLEKYSGKKAGADFGVCMNPEYLREVSAVYDFQHPWIVVIGSIDKRSGDVLGSLYEPVECPVVHVSLSEAQMCKYVHNLFDACKITFFNEMRMVCEETGIDADTVFAVVEKSCQSCWDPHYGMKDLGPYGGSCFPKDTAAFLSWGKRYVHLPLHLLQAIIRVNDEVRERRSSLSYKLKKFMKRAHSNFKKIC